MQFLVVFLLLFVTTGFSQTIKDAEKATIRVVAKSFGDSITLRYAPTTSTVWSMGNRNGYNIIRYVIIRNGKKLKTPERVILTSAPVKPLPLAEWEGIAKRNSNAAIAAQCLYGKKLEVTGTGNQGNIGSVISSVKESEMRFSFSLFAADQSLEVAMASGLMFTDINVKKGEKYVYRVFTDRNKENIENTGSVFIGTDDLTTLPSIEEFNANFSDRTVMLSWNNRYYKDFYNTYQVERSDDGGNTFKPTHDLPFVNTSPTPEKNTEYIFKMDSLPENGKNYIFRVKGKTLFDEVGPPSDTAAGMGKAAMDMQAPAIIKAEHLKTGAIKLNFRFSDKPNVPISEIEILRAEKNEGNLVSIGKVNNEVREFLDHAPKRINYYVIKINSEHGSAITSLPYMVQTIDSIPPAPPTGLSGIIDSSGVTRIIWNKGIGEDLAYYKVYMANGPEEEFTQVTKAPINDTLFSDSINIKTLTSKVYYKVMALDFNYNPSSFSEVLELKRPDVVPPSSPVFDNYIATDSSIYLHWIPSSSTDVVTHVLLRKVKSDSQWERIVEFKKDSFVREFTDFKAEKLKDYEYSIVAVDNSGLESPKENIISVSLIDRGFRPEILDFKGTADRTKKEIVLSWDYGTYEPEKFLIYKGKNGEPVRIYKAISGQEKGFVDRNLEIATEYTYRVMAVWGDGGSSILAKGIAISY